MRHKVSCSVTPYEGWNLSTSYVANFLADFFSHQPWAFGPQRLVCFSSFIGWKASSCLTGCDAWQRKRQTRRCTSRLSPNSDSRKHNSFVPNPSPHKITQSKKFFGRQKFARLFAASVIYLREHRSAIALLLWGKIPLIRRLGGTIDRWSCTRRGLGKRNRSVPGVRFVRLRVFALISDVEGGGEREWVWDFGQGQDA